MPTDPREDYDAIERSVVLIFEDVIGTAPGHVTPESRLVEDLGCDSIAIVQCAMAIEDAYDIENFDKQGATRILPTPSGPPVRVKDWVDFIYETKPE
ncbi:MAG: phosphopantetheine-binding protein [Planctomycetota bacterium]